MISTNNIKHWFIWMCIGQIRGASYNQPKFCRNTSWTSAGTTFAGPRIIGSDPYTIFINTNDTMYVPNRDTGSIVIWSKNQSTPSKYISVNSILMRGLFVLTENDLYFDAMNATGTVGRWTSDSTSFIPIMYTCSRCCGLFIDILNRLYCSMDDLHAVIRKSLADQTNTMNIVAGTGVVGSTADTLDTPNGIFVDDDYDLYVADCLNDRVQLFRSGDLNAITLAGDTSLVPTISLSRPTGIILDADKYLYIADHLNDRIVASSANGFRCVVGCNANGESNSELWQPRGLQFDSYGNLFVVDFGNDRIRKFLLINNFCNQTMTNQLPISMTTSDPTNGGSHINNSNTDEMLVSYNQPKLSSYAVWNTNGMTFANRSLIGSMPRGMFINKNNTIYVSDQENNRLQIWLENTINPLTKNFPDLTSTDSIFVTMTGDMYANTQTPANRINKYTMNASTGMTVMSLSSACYSIFIDRKNRLYCSMRDLHQVFRRSLNENSSIIDVVAGTVCNGTSSNALSNPNGVFVVVNFDLYVADSGNNRIQLYRSEQLHAITIVGSGSIDVTTTLNYPTSVALDADQYVFIVDSNNHRIIRQDRNGYRCIIGCNGPGSAANQLNTPYTMAFDSYGNIYLTDQSNSRIQKFLLGFDSSDQRTTAQISAETTQRSTVTTPILATITTTTTKTTTTTSISAATTQGSTTTTATSSAMINVCQCCFQYILSVYFLFFLFL